MKADIDSARVKFPPPLIALLSILFGAVLNWFRPAPMVSESLRWPLGALLILGGVGIAVSCSRLFKKAQTNIAPSKTTSHIVTTGVYGLSRNPIYLSFVIVGVGIAFAVNSLWIALVQIPVVLLIRKFVIANEEHYLESKFGDEYRSYKRNVRRWI
ncbi:MAG TPA: isoprenylcysteine carboxylmethyltransferase family protein [Elusimicrobiota bacterium]|nr:isoprenylcysteine carboxylmethyltransferase family protein [Elusimicrobiota bacterium]